MKNKEYILWVICLLLGSVLVLFQGYLGGEMVFGKGAGVKPMESMMESQEKKGSGHEHGGKKESKDDEGKEEMNHENMTEPGINSEEPRKKDEEKKQMNDQKNRKGEHDMKNMNNAKEKKDNHQMDNMNNSGNKMKDHGNMKNMNDTKDAKAEHNMSNMEGQSQMKEMKNHNMSGMNMNNPLDTFKFEDNNPVWQKAQKEKKKIKK